MRHLRMIAICCLITLMFAGCGSSVASSLPDNDEIKAAQDEVPFTILLPTYLPDGYTFSGIQVMGPPPGVEQADPKYTALLAFADDDEGYLEIAESNFQLQLSDDTDAIELSETTTAQFNVQELPDGRTRRELAFSSNDVGIIVTALELAKSEMVMVAKSLLED